MTNKELTKEIIEWSNNQTYDFEDQTGITLNPTKTQCYILSDIIRVTGCTSTGLIYNKQYTRAELETLLKNKKK